MTKIVIDARESGTSSGRYVDKLVENLHAAKPEFEFVVLAKPHRLEYLRQIAPSFTIVEAPFKEFTFDEQLGFKKLIKSLKPGLTHFVMVQQPVSYRGKTVTTMNDLTTVRFRNPAKNPVVFTIKQLIYKWLNKRVAKKSNALITFTDFVKNDVVQFAGVDPKKINTIYLAADAIPEKPEPLSDLIGKKFIMYVGRPMPHKNLERLIEAFTKLKSAHPDLYLVLAGKKDFNYNQVEAGVKQQDIKNVVFTDFISEGQLRWLYENTATYVFPSLSEGFGLPGLEAMMHGAPVVSSNATCLPEVYGDAAYYFNPLNVPAMADAINDVLVNKDLREDLVKKGYAQAKKYSWSRMAQQTLDVYKKVLTQK